MTTERETLNYGPVLFHYDLFPEKLERHGRVMKVITKRGTFALKEAEMSEDERNWFTHVIQRLSEIGFHQVVPLYPTKFGDYTVQLGSKTYYLMPWFASDDRNEKGKEEILLDQIGRIHALTLKEQDFSNEVVEHSYQFLMNRWENRQFEMERFTEEAEQKTYMSPFELTYLSHFHQIMRMTEEAKRRLKDWYDTCQREKRYRSVLCHGKVSRNHLIFNPTGEGHLLNFEKAVLDTPVRDLAVYFRRAVHQREWSKEHGKQLLDIYEKHVPLLNEERGLFISYLSYPEPVFNAVDLYYHKRNQLSQIELVHRLEKRIRAMKNIRDFCELIMQTPPPPLEMGNAPTKIHINDEDHI
ncbi:spore coat protein YsxE [Fictibacillus barbaricus]|uniref:Spore coat protein YsxE n=1 Tax=Fictibacillus barbaricus TaxID=182136 RepID=A0ABU1U2F2_9BACL|nr:spore coat protein YsxE [Fictibacillus barbaricus]MDR7073667.1 spore coat protein YsxE [Fictibacillus barbaricus]